jgi:hypothetical protein
MQRNPVLKNNKNEPFNIAQWFSHWFGTYEEWWGK